MPKLRTPSVAELVALGGSALLLIALWQPWFTLSIKMAGFSVSVGGNAWQVFDVFDWIFAGLAVITAGIVLGELAGIRVVAGDVGRAVMSVGATVVVSAAIRWFDRPGPRRGVTLPEGVEIAAQHGLYMAAVAGVVIAAGGYLISKDAAVRQAAPVATPVRFDEWADPSAPAPMAPSAWDAPAETATVGQGAPLPWGNTPPS